MKKADRKFTLLKEGFALGTIYGEAAFCLRLAFSMMVFHLFAPSMVIPQASEGVCRLRLRGVGYSCDRFGNLAEQAFHLFLDLSYLLSVPDLAVHAFHFVVVMVRLRVNGFLVVRIG